MSVASLNFLSFVIVAILFAAIAIVASIPVSYIVGGVGTLLAIGLVVSFGKHQPV